MNLIILQFEVICLPAVWVAVSSIMPHAVWVAVSSIMPHAVWGCRVQCYAPCCMGLLSPVLCLLLCLILLTVLFVFYRSSSAREQSCWAAVISESEKGDPAGDREQYAPSTRCAAHRLTIPCASSSARRLWGTRSISPSHAQSAPTASAVQR